MQGACLVIAGFLPSSALPAFRLVGSLRSFDKVTLKPSKAQTSRAYSGLQSMKQLKLLVLVGIVFSLCKMIFASPNT